MTKENENDVFLEKKSFVSVSLFIIYQFDDIFFLKELVSVDAQSFLKLLGQ